MTCYQILEKYEPMGFSIYIIWSRIFFVVVVVVVQRLHFSISQGNQWCSINPIHFLNMIFQTVQSLNFLWHIHSNTFYILYLTFHVVIFFFLHRHRWHFLLPTFLHLLLLSHSNRLYKKKTRISSTFLTLHNSQPLLLQWNYSHKMHDWSNKTQICINSLRIIDEITS